MTHTGTHTANKTRKVVITGIGLVSPLGVGTQVTWQNLLQGKSGIRRISQFNAEGYACQVAGEVPPPEEPHGFKVEDWIPFKDQKKMDRFIQLGMCAAEQAVQHAKLADVPEDAKERIGVILGSGIGGLPEIEQTHQTLLEKGPKRVSPFFIPSILANMLAGQVSIKYGYKGVNSCVVTACATGAHAIGEAYRSILLNENDIVLAGGAEACICPTAVAGFAAAKALSTGFNHTPEQASRPFDASRDGFVMAEGAAVLVLEEYTHAKARGATIFAEVAGFSQTADAYHMTMPSGHGSRKAMQLALADAGLTGADIGYVNPHATSTPAGDGMESAAIEEIIGTHAPVSATKSMIGHSLGAAGGIEAAVCALSLYHQHIHPTINLQQVSADCRLNYVPNGAQPLQFNAALSNSFGFGGTNACLVFKKV